MLRVGIADEKNQAEIEKEMKSLCARAGEAAEIGGIGGMGGAEVDVLIANSPAEGLAEAAKRLSKDSLLIVNADDREACRQTAGSPAMMITYGFNPKACVTASSVSDGELQVCIQRALPTMGGGMLEQQEFGVVCERPGQDPAVALAAATAAAVGCGRPVG